MMCCSWIFARYFTKSLTAISLVNCNFMPGVQGSLLRWIKDFLTNQVIIDDKRSDSCNVLSGVPQGTVLAPLLFLIYINDLSLHISNKVRLYANDVILYSYIYSMDDCRKLQKDLGSLTQWSMHIATNVL